MLVVLTGGTGGAKLVHGLSLETEPKNLFIICNTGDDFILHGLNISPDLDTITYTLAGVGDATKGWGVQGDTFNALEQLDRYGGEAWFKLGDRDLATHLRRTKLLSDGANLSQVTDQIRRALGVEATIRPMSNDRIETRVKTVQEEMSFQEYFVKERWRPDVKRVLFAGADRSRPAPGTLEAIQTASAVIVCPSNPVTSIGPILAVPGIRAALKKTAAPIIAVSPIIRGAPVSGPAHKLMAAGGMEVSALGVARNYADFVKIFAAAPEDAGLKEKIEALGLKFITTSIRMDTLAAKRRLAREVLAFVSK